MILLAQSGSVLSMSPEKRGGEGNSDLLLHVQDHHPEEFKRANEI